MKAMAFDDFIGVPVLTPPAAADGNAKVTKEIQDYLKYRIERECDHIKRTLLANLDKGVWPVGWDMDHVHGLICLGYESRRANTPEIRAAIRDIRKSMSVLSMKIP